LYVTFKNRSIVIIVRVIFNLILVSARSLTNARIIVLSIVDFKIEKTIIEDLSFFLYTIL